MDRERKRTRGEVIREGERKGNRDAGSLRQMIALRSLALPFSSPQVLSALLSAPPMSVYLSVSV
eukprot:2706461-Rhodomonas_salina.1